MRIAGIEKVRSSRNLPKSPNEASADNFLKDGTLVAAAGGHLHLTKPQVPPHPKHFALDEGPCSP